MNQPFVCTDCGERSEAYMVEDTLWLSVFPNLRGFCCIKCFEIRIGRKLMLTDLADKAINREILLGYAIARRETDPDFRIKARQFMRPVVREKTNV